MDEKIKVKDLAADLGVSTKDLTRVLRELEVEVKSAASTVTPEEAAKAKARLQPEAAAEVMRKEIQPGVIVRRRRARPDSEAETASNEDAASSAPEASTESEPKADVERSARAHDSEENTPELSAAPVEAVIAETGAPCPAESEKKARRKKAPVETPPARSDGNAGCRAGCRHGEGRSIIPRSFGCRVRTRRRTYGSCVSSRLRHSRRVHARGRQDPFRPPPPRSGRLGHA